MTLDSSAAWHDARRLVSANRDVLAAIGGVFFVLPGLISVLVLPVPQVTGTMDPQQMSDAIARFYTASAPAMLALSLPILAGYLTLLAMLLDRDRPTVGAAIVRALRLLPSYLAAQLLTGAALSVLWLIAFGLLAAALPVMIAVVASLVVMIYPLIRVLLIGPAMVARRIRNPFSAIGAALAHTRGHAAALLLFFGPAVTLFVVVYALVMLLVRVVLATVIEGEAQRLAVETFGALLMAAGQTYFAAMVAATYRQLGPIRGAAEAISPSSPG